MTDTMHTISANGLLTKWGFGDGDEPDEVMDEQFGRHSRSTSLLDLPGDWREDILIPVARDVLVPALPVPVECNYMTGSSHNPARAHMIDGQPHDYFDYQGSKRYEPLFGSYKITFLVPYLVDVLEGHRSLEGLDRLSGIDLDLLTAAFAAGLSVTEIATLNNQDGLDVDTLTVMTALRA